MTHPIVRFLARRLLYSLVVLIGVLVVVFALVHLVPGDPVRIALGTRYTPQAYDALRSASGLDRPIVEQFFSYIGSALTGDLGVSFRNGDPVTVTLLERLPATVSLGRGRHRHRAADRAARRASGPRCTRAASATRSSGSPASSGCRCRTSGWASC